MQSKQLKKESRIRQVIQMMAIPGKSGEEKEIANYIRNQLIRVGADRRSIQTDTAHRRTVIKGNSGNLVLKMPGTYRAPRRMLSAHMDTVPICEGCRPVRKGMIVTSKDPATGLGADNRAGCGVILSAAQEILKNKLPHPPLTFAWFVQEEVGLQGSRYMTQRLLGNPQLAFNWDGGSAVKMTVGATGGYRMQIIVNGIASHAGVAPQRGVSAIAITSLAIADLHRNGWHGQIRKGQNKGTSNIGVIQGGAATNVVTDRVVVRAEARSHNRRFRERIVREMERAFKRAVAQVKNDNREIGAVEIAGHLDYESFVLSKKEPCVRIARNVIQSKGEEPVFAVADGGLDANWITDHGIPAVSMGAGQLNAHMVSESLDLKQYLIACEIGLSIAMGEAD